MHNTNESFFSSFSRHCIRSCLKWQILQIAIYRREGGPRLFVEITILTHIPLDNIDHLIRLSFIIQYCWKLFIKIDGIIELR